jgi:tetratricopeptide (TPR) repeat protein
MIAASGVLALGGIFFLGFLFGQKAARSEDASHKNAAQESEFASPDSEVLLDKAFGEMGQGDYRQAMEDFQKVQDNQPALTGLDYLIAESAYRAGEEEIAREKAASAISKDESADNARVLIALMNLNKTGRLQQEETQFADPKVTAETEIHHFAAAHPSDARIYILWGDLLRAEGSYRTAGDMFHKGVLRASPEEARELLSAKEQLARLQNDPASTVPSLSGLTAMTAEQSLAAALTALQQHKSEDAAAFMERARDLYSPEVFRELMEDAAFTDYLADPEMKQFFKPKRTTTAS